MNNFTFTKILTDAISTARRALHRFFWGLYGRHVWDDGKVPTLQEEYLRVLHILLAHRKKNGELVLDAGCGTGEFSRMLAGAGFAVTGVDYSSGMLDRARTKLTDVPQGMLSFRQADLDKPLDFPDNHFDHIISVSVLPLITKKNVNYSSPATISATPRFIITQTKTYLPLPLHTRRCWH